MLLLVKYVVGMEAKLASALYLDDCISLFITISSRSRFIILWMYLEGGGGTCSLPSTATATPSTRRTIPATIETFLERLRSQDGTMVKIVPIPE